MENMIRLGGHLTYCFARELQDAGFPRENGRLVNGRPYCVKPNGELTVYRSNEDHPAYPGIDELQKAITEECPNIPLTLFAGCEQELAEVWLECRYSAKYFPDDSVGRA